MPVEYLRTRGSLIESHRTQTNVFIPLHNTTHTNDHQDREPSSTDAAAPAPAAVESLDPPLAKLIPHMKNAAARVFHNDPQENEYIRVTTDNRAVNLLCRYG